MGLFAGETVAFICMIEWGLIHVAAMFMIGVPAWSDKLGASGAYGAYDLLLQDDKYKKEYDDAKHPRLSGKILWQHGFNLGWCGLFACVGVPLCIFYENRMAWVMTLVPFLTDVGYFVAFDLFKLGGGMAQAAESAAATRTPMSRSWRWTASTAVWGVVTGLKSPPEL